MNLSFWCEIVCANYCWVLCVQRRQRDRHFFYYYLSSGWDAWLKGHTAQPDRMCDHVLRDELSVLWTLYSLLKRARERAIKTVCEFIYKCRAGKEAVWKNLYVSSLEIKMQFQVDATLRESCVCVCVRDAWKNTPINPAGRYQNAKCMQSTFLYYKLIENVVSWLAKKQSKHLNIFSLKCSTSFNFILHYNWCECYLSVYIYYMFIFGMLQVLLFIIEQYYSDFIDTQCRELRECQVLFFWLFWLNLFTCAQWEKK